MIFHLLFAFKIISRGIELFGFCCKFSPDWLGMGQQSGECCRPRSQSPPILPFINSNNVLVSTIPHLGLEPPYFAIARGQFSVLSFFSFSTACDTVNHASSDLNELIP